MPPAITTFEAVNISIERAESIEPTLVEPDDLTNDRPPGRAYVFAIDALDGCAALRARRFLRQFLDDSSATTILPRWRSSGAGSPPTARTSGRAIDEADPIGLLGMGCPGDEYSSEIGAKSCCARGMP
jgi:hypothetical protein